MRISLLLITLLCLCFQAKAQKKNEIQIGATATYFFDDTPYLFHNFKRGTPFPTHINYTRSLTDKNGLSFSFDHLWLVYNPPSAFDSPKLFLRDYLKLSIEFYRQKRMGRFSISGKAGIGYRFRGGETFMSRSFWESHFSHNYYNHIGLTTGIQAKVQLYRNLSAVAKLNYSRYFAEHSPNELHNIFGLGYEF